MSRSLSTNSGSSESLNCRARCGWSPRANARSAPGIPLAGGLGHAALVRCVASCGGPPWSAPRRPRHRGIELRNAPRPSSRRTRSTPSAAKRSCQRQTQVLDACFGGPSGTDRSALPPCKTTGPKARKAERHQHPRRRLRDSTPSIANTLAQFNTISLRRRYNRVQPSGRVRYRSSNKMDPALAPADLSVA